MRLGRAFSTTLQHNRQALYEPYSPPLSSEHQKALRKLMTAREPKYHSKFNAHAERLLEVYSPLANTLEQRIKTVRMVTKMVRSAFGPDYTVLDRSMYQYSRDCAYAPLELAVVDKSRPTGFSPGQIGPQFPDPYNHEALAKLLQRHGFSGSFIAGDAMRNQPPKGPVEEDPDGAIERGPFPLAHPWPSYIPYPSFHPTYPPVLWADPGTAHEGILPFFLSPPVPVYAPLLRLLKAYCAARPELRDIITYLLIWTRSVNLIEFTPTCIALMAIAAYQHKGFVLNLQMPEDPGIIAELAEQNDGVWFTKATPINGGSDRIYSSTWLETGFFSTPPVSKYTKKMSRLLQEFFSFWGIYNRESPFHSANQYVSLREGTILNRESRMAMGFDVGKVLRRDDEDIVDGKAPSPDDQPKMWQTQPIVVEDPFVRTYNHAHCISKAAGSFFHYYCAISRKTMIRGHPMHTIIGPHLTPPRVLSRGYSSTTTTISQEIKHMYDACLPPQPILEARKMTISRVQNAITKRFGRGYIVECFGSTSYGVSTPTSDLDLVVIDTNNANGFRTLVRPKRLPEVYNVWVVSRILIRSGFTGVIAIPKAKVPIVKFRDPQSNLECDLNINEQLGLWNTRLTARYCELAPDILRPLLIVIKRWARSNGLIDPSGAFGPISFSSYALILMTIGYLQWKGILPNLQAGLDPLSHDAKQGIFWLRSGTGTSAPCDIRFKSGHDWTPRVHLSLEEALIGWFNFWANEFQYEENLLSIREGGLCVRSRKKKPTKRKKAKKLADRISDAEFQQLRTEEAEDAVLAAYADQNESGKSEDVSDTDETESTDLTASDDELRNPTLPTEDSEGGVDHFRLSITTIPSPEQTVGPTEGPTETEISRDGATETAGREFTREPVRWADHRLVVADPFNLSNNVTGAIWKGNVLRFQEECRSSLSMLEWGSSLEDLMGNLEFSKPQKQTRNKGKNSGKKKGKKKSVAAKSPSDDAQMMGVSGGHREIGVQEGTSNLAGGQ